MSVKYKICENCETEFKDSFKFCPNCGMKNREELTLGSLFYNTINNYLLWDSKFLKSFAKALAVGFNISSLLFINFKTILFADFGPKPGNLDINFTSSSISLISCILLKRKFKPRNTQSSCCF